MTAGLHENAHIFPHVQIRTISRICVLHQRPHITYTLQASLSHDSYSPFSLFPSLVAVILQQPQRLRPQLLPRQRQLQWKNTPRLIKWFLFVCIVHVQNTEVLKPHPNRGKDVARQLKATARSCRLPTRRGPLKCHRYEKDRRTYTLATRIVIRI